MCNDGCVVSLKVAGQCILLQYIQVLLMGLWWLGVFLGQGMGKGLWMGWCKGNGEVRIKEWKNS